MSRIEFWSDFRSWQIGAGVMFNSIGGRFTIQVGPFSMAIRWGRCQRFERLIGFHHQRAGWWPFPTR